MTIQDTLNQRNNVHGDYAEQSKLHDELMALIEPYLKKLSPQHRQALNLINMKQSRILVGNSEFPDHWHDIGGYATLGEQNCRYVDPNQQTLDLGETKTFMARKVIDISHSLYKKCDDPTHSVTSNGVCIVCNP